ncbi:MAG: L-lactate dehydrogenase, partial [Clostridiales bacterium]|nr:L-lactate dehydrogenase [Clostridiales bacterium]
MYKQEGTKVAIIGAGAVGSTTAFAIAMQQLCSELVLIDVNKEKALGEALDISHGLPFIGDMYIHAGDYSDVKDADCIIITAGIPRKEGETRLDLAKKNVKLAHIITDSIMEHYNKGVIMVISNPCDLVTYKVAEWSGLPSSRIIGSGTNLDSARFRVLISRKLGVDVRNVHGYILGEHGETQFPAWSHTHVAGMGIDEYAEAIGVPFGPEVKDEIAQQTKSSGAQIIKL